MNDPDLSSSAPLSSKATGVTRESESAALQRAHEPRSTPEPARNISTTRGPLTIEERAHRFIEDAVDHSPAGTIFVALVTGLLAGICIASLDRR